MDKREIAPDGVRDGLLGAQLALAAGQVAARAFAVRGDLRPNTCQLAAAVGILHVGLQL